MWGISSRKHIAKLFSEGRQDLVAPEGAAPDEEVVARVVPEPMLLIAYSLNVSACFLVAVRILCVRCLFTISPGAS